MKKHFIAILCSLFILCWATGASASANILNYAYTSDNSVIDFSIFGSDGSTASLGSKLSHWTQPLSGTYDNLLSGVTYTLQWEVENENGAFPSSQDPMAFLGQFSVNGINYLSGTDSIWAVSIPGSENVPTAYGALNDSSKIWYNSGYATLGGIIADSAQWIGLGPFPGIANSMTITATFTTPVPIPGAALLLGSGLLGLIGVRRKQLV